MPIFQVTPLSNNHDAVEGAVVGGFEAKDRHQLPNSAGWLVRHPGTTIEVSNHLGITGQVKGEPSQTGATLVSLVGSYYGRGPSDLWEWLKTRFENES